MNQELACAILTRFGHEVDVAGDGAKAIKAVKRKAYELILMDVQMPKLDGISATKLIRAMEGPIANIPIIALTANVLPEQVRQYRQAGVSDHVAKPIKQPICSARSSGSWKWCRKALMRSNSTTRRSRRCETSCRQTAFASISIFLIKSSNPHLPAAAIRTSKRLRIKWFRKQECSASNVSPDFVGSWSKLNPRRAQRSWMSYDRRRRQPAKLALLLAEGAADGEEPVSLRG